MKAAHIPGRMERSFVGHRAIIERLKAADPTGVEGAAVVHCRKASEDLMKEFKRTGNPGPLSKAI